MFNCWHKDSTPTPGIEPDLSKVFALKIIKKEKITSFNGLKRLANEIEILKLIKSKYVISLNTAFQTKHNMYLITSKGGSDLFDFFDENPDGVSEEWAKEIMGCIFRGIKYIHELNICHRGKSKIC